MLADMDIMKSERLSIKSREPSLKNKSTPRTGTNRNEINCYIHSAQGEIQNTSDVESE